MTGPYAGMDVSSVRQAADLHRQEAVKGRAQAAGVRAGRPSAVVLDDPGAAALSPGGPAGISRGLTSRGASRSAPSPARPGADRGSRGYRLSHPARSASAGNPCQIVRAAMLIVPALVDPILLEAEPAQLEPGSRLLEPSEGRSRWRAASSPDLDASW